MLALVFAAQGLPAEHLLHWPIARTMAPGMLAGAFDAALAAGLIPTRPLAVMFTCMCSPHACLSGSGGRRRHAATQLGIVDYPTLRRSY